MKLFVLSSLLILFFIFISSASSDAIRLTDDNVDDHLTGGDWLILFLNGKSAKEEKEWKELADHLKETKSQYRAAKVDCDKYPDVCYDRQLKLKDLPKKFLAQITEDNYTPIEGSTPTEILSSASYVVNGDVVVLTKENIAQVRDGNKWLVEFYAPWCGHCQRLTPEWKKAATALKDVVKVGAVNADKHQSLGGQYGVQGFPTIKIFGANKNKPEDYQGGRTGEAIVDAALSALRQLVKDRLGGRSGGYSSGKQGRGDSSSKKDVVELTDDTFDKNVLDSEDVWMVEFYAPWCGHCKNLEPEWAAAATEVKEQTKGKVKLAAVDATMNQVLASRYGIKGFPTIKIFQKGESPVDYDGGRTRSDIVSRALDLFSDNAPPPELLEIINEDIAKKTCEEHQLCVVAVLPHILDTGAAGRNSYLEVLLKLADKYKKKMWGWLWTEAGAQYELENALGIGGFGYPAMAAINARKMKFALLKGSFSEQGINEFLRELSFGRGSTAPVGGGSFPTITPREPWDGKDGELPVEDDIDLSDVELDDLEKDEL